jgi:hypothetical protein
MILFSQKAPSKSQVERKRGTAHTAFPFKKRGFVSIASTPARTTRILVLLSFMLLAFSPTFIVAESTNDALETGKTIVTALGQSKVCNLFWSLKDGNSITVSS